MAYAVAVDIGGMFTDLVGYDHDSRQVICTKAPTSYDNFWARHFRTVSFNRNGAEEPRLKFRRVSGSPLNARLSLSISTATVCSKLCFGSRLQLVAGSSLNSRRRDGFYWETWPVPIAAA
jgi:hypothetical protein